MDNSTTVAYINNRGGTDSVPLMSLTLEIWTWCLHRDFLISAQNVLGKENTIANRESCTFLDSSDWLLDPKVITPFLTNCNTDLFPSRLAAQLPQRISWRPDPGAFHIDALTLHWNSLRGYAFPPFNLIPVVLNKVIQDNADLALVAPIWQAQPWWPILLSLLVSNPVLLPHSPHPLHDPSNPNRMHPMFPRLHLTVFHISNNATRQRAFLNRLPNCSPQQLGPPLARPTSQHDPARVAGVLKGN